MILENVWGPGYASEPYYLKVYAYRIRRKLGDEQGNFLQSHRTRPTAIPEKTDRGVSARPRCRDGRVGGAAS
jgi:hypothetical protein